MIARVGLTILSLTLFVTNAIDGNPWLAGMMAACFVSNGYAVAALWRKRV